MRRAVLAFLSLLLPVGAVSHLATAHPRPPTRTTLAVPSGSHRVPTLALNPIAGTEMAARFVEGTNVAALHAAAALLDARTVYEAAAVRTVRVVAVGYSGAPAAVTYTGDISQVVACIKNAESGNYRESSHPNDGSGAYQFIPHTWRTYFLRWLQTLDDKTRSMIPDFQLAYQADPWVQDAVLAYTLTHGGAGNWSNRYGRDHCTAGLPGGG